MFFHQWPTKAQHWLEVETFNVGAAKKHERSASAYLIPNLKLKILPKKFEILSVLLVIIMKLARVFLEIKFCPPYKSCSFLASSMFLPWHRSENPSFKNYPFFLYNLKHFSTYKKKDFRDQNHFLKSNFGLLSHLSAFK